MEVEACIFHVRILIDLLDTAGVERGRAPLDAVNLVSLLQQQRRKIGAVLAGDTRDERNFRCQIIPLSCSLAMRITSGSPE
ncbi:hypothetical protein SZ64_16135 [Erythrobacter sp. SG61-1L]|nr:hypothetical protein SZ64_16135 [Erythrobacter sp. SG61-1L]